MTSPTASGESHIPETVYLVGPTAVGKSELAVLLAERMGAEIVGCDAFQLYAGLPILTAQPDTLLRRRVPHHLVAEVPLQENFDVARYLALANTRISEVHQRGRRALVVGGSGMYFRALTRGLADLPPADFVLRKELESTPLPHLLDRLAALDPKTFLQIDRQNPRRVIRAVEVCLLTGSTFSSFRQEWASPPARLRGVLLERSSESLRTRIDRRVVEMFGQGVEAEVRNCGMLSPTSSQTLGLSTIRELLRGTITTAEAVIQIQRSTRQYAKRQRTWFAKENWLERLQLDSMPALARQADAVAAFLESRD
jgi:tRNA dimethylallyltransferase